MLHFDALKIYSCGKHCKKEEFACINVSYEYPLNFYQTKALSFCKGLEVVFFGKGLCAVITGGHWFYHRLGQYLFPGLMVVIATGIFPP